MRRNKNKSLIFAACFFILAMLKLNVDWIGKCETPAGTASSGSAVKSPSEEARGSPVERAHGAKINRQI